MAPPIPFTNFPWNIRLTLNHMATEEVEDSYYLCACKPVCPLYVGKWNRSKNYITSYANNGFAFYITLGITPSPIKYRDINTVQLTYWDHPVGEVAILRHLHSTQYSEVYMSTSDHSEWFITGEICSPFHYRDSLLASIYQIRVFCPWFWEWTLANTANIQNYYKAAWQTFLISMVEHQHAQLSLSRFDFNNHQ